jgi:hypothetical protein
MQEVLTNTVKPNVLLQEQECYALRLDDLSFPFSPQFIDRMGTLVRHRFLVSQAHAAWSEIDGNVMWDGYEHDECSTLQEAELRYELRRAALVLKGFIYSDMEL